MFLKNNGWKECVPGNYEWVKEECIEIFDTELFDKPERKPDMSDRPRKWVEQYKEWDAKWNS
jgi:hypothetical protein